MRVIILLTLVLSFTVPVRALTTEQLSNMSTTSELLAKTAKNLSNLVGELASLEYPTEKKGLILVELTGIIQSCADDAANTSIFFLTYLEGAPKMSCPGLSFNKVRLKSHTEDLRSHLSDAAYFSSSVSKKTEMAIEMLEIVLSLTEKAIPDDCDSN